MDGDTLSRPIPWRTIWATIGSVVVTVLALALVSQLHRVLVWLAVAAFLAVALNPAVDFLVTRLRCRRGVAVTTVVLIALVALGAISFALVQPLVTEGQELADDFPRYVEEAKAGQGPIGELVRRYELEDRIQEQQDQIRSHLGEIGSQSLRVLGAIGNAVAGTLTVFVMTFLMLLEGPQLLEAASRVLSPERRERVSRVAADCTRAVTGYVAGNLLISVICGLATFIFLWIVGVPFKGVLAVFVAIADLIPMVGATIGAAVVIAVAFLHSPAAGIAAIVFFVVYQQIENHLLQPLIQARTVKLLPLTVLVSVLIGAEVSGLLGALLAIPVAGIIKVIARDLWDNRRGRPKEDPTIGEDEVPLSATEDAPPSERDDERAETESARLVDLRDGGMG